jgi:thiamine biosynthesis lipoprotein
MTASAVWEDWSCRVRLTVTDDATLERARQRLTGLMGEVERASSRFLPTSDVSRVNRGAGQLVPVSRRAVALVDVAIGAAAETGGLVDPTVGAHVIRAGYAADIELVRDRLILSDNDDAAPRRAEWQSVQVDHDLSRLGIPVGLALDLGATAKPWTADAAAHAIAAAFGTGVLVEIGGDVAVAGHKPVPWQIQVSEQAGEPGEQVGLTRGGLATSSSARRRWRTPNGPAHHIIDPRTGEPATGPWRTATVWARSAVDANTASTAAIILGEEAPAFLERFGHPARLVGHDGCVETIGAWPSARRVA